MELRHGFETLPKGRQGEQDSRLHEQLAYLWRRSEFFRRKLRKGGYQPQTEFDRGDFSCIPLSDKRELLAMEPSPSAASASLAGVNQCVSRAEIVRITYSGGTSAARPRPIGWTQRDINDYSEMGARALRGAGVTAEHVVINCFNYRLYAGGVMDQMAFERLGAAVVSYGVGGSKGLLALLSDLSAPLVLYCTPSYAMRLAKLAQTEGIDPRDLGVAIGVLSGESGLQHPSVRASIEQAWGMNARNFYGIAELGVQCSDTAAQQALHYTSSDLVLAELVDPVSLEPLPLAPGQTGELVFTTLRRQACPLLRYRSHDVVRILSTAGRNERWAEADADFTFEHLYRGDDMIKVNGVNVFAGDIQVILHEIEEPALTRNFQVGVAPEAGALGATLELESGPLSMARQQALREQLERTLRDRIHFVPQIKFVPVCAFEQETKVRRFQTLTGGSH